MWTRWISLSFKPIENKDKCPLWYDVSYAQVLSKDQYNREVNYSNSFLSTYWFIRELICLTKQSAFQATTMTIALQNLGGRRAHKVKWS